MSKKQQIVLLVLIIILILGGVSYGAYNKWRGETKRVACTMEAKLCSDGSAVGRTGPNCEFTACPEAGENSICKDLCGNGSCQEIVCMGSGCPCAETAESCPQDCAKSTGDDLTSCQTDSDCACGTKINTGECFVGNKKYVNVLKQCPDYCSGLTGHLIISCVDGLCQQVEN